MYKNSHILVTGHSGSGKSTYAKNLAESKGLELEHLDKHDIMREIFSQGNSMSGDGSWADKEGELLKDFLASRLSHGPERVIEGSQLLHLDSIPKGSKGILIDLPEDRILDQGLRRKLQRMAERGETIDRNMDYSEGRRNIINEYRNKVDRFRELDNVESVVPSLDFSLLGGSNLNSQYTKTSEEKKIYRPRATIFLTDKDKILAQKYKWGPNNSTYAFPGGGINPDEDLDTFTPWDRPATHQEAIAGAGKEALEELGIELSSPRVLGDYKIDIDDPAWRAAIKKNWKNNDFHGVHEYYVAANRGSSDNSLLDVHGDKFNGEYYPIEDVIKAVELDSSRGLRKATNWGGTEANLGQLAALKSLAENIKTSAEKIRLFHGSPHDVDYIEPREPSRPGNFPGGYTGVYTHPTLEAAAMYALARDKENTRRKWGVTASGKLVALPEMPINDEGYVYEYETDNYIPPPDTQKALGYAILGNPEPIAKHKVLSKDFIDRVVRAKSRESFMDEFKDLARAEDGADFKPSHVLITGPSGSGKTTKAKQLSNERNLPIISLDNTSMSLDQLKDLPTPHIIEGRQLLEESVDPKFLLDNELHVLDAPEDVLADRLLSRGYIDESGKTISGRENLDKARHVVSYQKKQLSNLARRLGVPVRTEKTAASAVIIKGNPRYLNSDYAKYYSDVADELRKSGYSDISFDTGEEGTVPRKADLWLGHSRGMSRLKFAPDGTKTLRIDDYEDEDPEYNKMVSKLLSELGVSNISEVPVDSRPVPGKSHYTMTSALRNAIRNTKTASAILRAYELGCDLAIKVAEDGVATKSDPELWSRAKSEAKSRMGGKHSARAMQLAVKIYKDRGGDYKGRKPSASQNKMRKWTKQDWQTRPGTDEIAKKEDGSTSRYLPKAKWDSLSKSEQKATDAKKLRSEEQYVENTDAAKVKGSAKYIKSSEFSPDYTPEDLKAMGVYDQVYGDAPSEASMKEWPAHWLHEQDPLGWLQWYERYSSGRRTDDDARQIKRWESFKARHGSQYSSKPTDRRKAALRNWGIDADKIGAK
jgi:adenylate kinase family enzyme/8-oxo-dGTP pyrophosphatase MutT (NUDIX family)